MVSIENLESYKKLYDEGVLSLEEFEALKKEAIDGITREKNISYANNTYANNTVVVTNTASISSDDDSKRIGAIVVAAILALVYAKVFISSLGYIEYWELRGALINLGGLAGMCGGGIITLALIKKDYSLLNVGVILLMVFNAFICMRDFLCFFETSYKVPADYAYVLCSICLTTAAVMLFLSFKNSIDNKGTVITVLAALGIVIWMYLEGVVYEDGIWWTLVGALDGAVIILLNYLDIKKKLEV